MADHIEEPREEQRDLSAYRPVSQPEELVDKLGQESARELIDEAIDKFAANSREESWSRRRERMLRLTRILEKNLDYDIDRFVPASARQ